MKDESLVHFTTNGSLAANFTSSTIEVARYDIFGIQVVFAGGGTPTGTFSVQVSNDGTTWATITGSETAITDDGDIFYNIKYMGYRELRVFYAYTSGDATVNIYLFKRQG